MIQSLLDWLMCVQKRKSATVSVEVKKSQHRYVIGPKGSGLTEILASTGVSVEIPPSDNVSETITLRGDPDKLGPALTLVYAKVTIANTSTTLCMEKNVNLQTLRNRNVTSERI